MTRRAMIFVLLLCLSSPADARADVEEDGVPDRPTLVRGVREWLRTGDRKHMAWAAYFAGRHALHEVAPELVEALRREDPEESLTPAVLAFRGAALDALIRTDHPAPPDVLARHAHGDLLPAVLVLLARRPVENRRALFRLFDECGGGKAWIAAGNLLASQRAPGFYRRVLAGLETELRIRVWSEKRSWRGPVGSVVGCGFDDTPEGYPPLILYRLTSPPPEAWPEELPPLRPHTLVADGPRPIHFVRIEADRIWTCTSGNPPDPDEVRAEWIHEVLARAGAEPPEDGIRDHRWWRLFPVDFRTDRGPPARLTMDARWTGATPLLDLATREHEALRTTFWAAAETLLGAGLLTEEEARGILPGIRIVFEDRRDDRRRALPEPPAPEPGNPFTRRTRQARRPLLR